MSAMALQLEDDGGFYVTVGDVVAGKYLIERVLGAGGMAFVLSARHVELDQHFALKFLDQRFLGNERLIERFTQEARAACKIRSEHVARVYDVGVHEGAPFFVMEHLEGRDLCAVVGESGPLAVEDAVEYVMQACEALAVAHCHGIVHRDIKPENLFLVEREGLPRIKVLDFGISKVALTAGEAPSRLTGELTLGTPCYMSPEQIRSTASADARSDQWSLGAVLYELLAGTEAFRAESISALCAAVLEREPEPLLQLRPELPQGLADVVMRCLEKDPASRFADVAELAMALLPYAPTRALVSAERSSSVMRGAARAATHDHRVSSVRPSALASSLRRPSSDAGSPPSAAPVARSVGPAAPGARVEPQKRGWRVVLGAAALAIMGALGIVAYGVRAERASPAGAPAAAVEALPPPSLSSPELAVVATTVRSSRAPEHAETTPRAVAAASSPKRLPAAPSAAASAPPRAAPSSSVHAAPLAASAGGKTEGAASARRASPSATPDPASVELGY